MSVADLYYFPLMAGDWLAGEAISMMTPEQEGAFVHLLCHAWQSNELPCSLPNDDRALAQLSRLGDRWSIEGALVRAQFVTVGKEKTRLRNPKLWDIFREFQEKHARRVASGRTGGIAKAKGKQSSSNARPKLEQSSSNQNHNHNKNPLPPSGDVDAVLSHYGQLHPKRKIVGKKLRSVVVRALADFSVPELIEALDGNAADEWHKERGKHELGYVLRDADIINGFRSRKNLPAPSGPSTTALARAARLYEAFTKHGFTRNLPIEEHHATIAALSAVGKIANGEQFLAEIMACRPWMWLGQTREVDKDKAVSRIAQAIAELQPKVA